MESGRLCVETRTLDGIPLIQPHGEIDIYTVPEFEQAVSGAVGGARIVIVDLSDISYLDSSGLSTLIGAYKALSAKGGELYIAAPADPPAVRRVLEITRLDAFVRIRGSLAEILEELELPQVA